MIEKGKALRFNEGKSRIDLIPDRGIEEIAKGFAVGAKKYGEWNYLAGQPWSTVIASLKRHVKAFASGEDIDKETGVDHLALAGCNIMMLLEYRKRFPQGDDRQHRYLDLPRIGLDLDGVLADFSTAYSAKMVAAGYKVPEESYHWSFPYGTNEVWESVKKDKDFWLNLKPLCSGKDLPFEPVCYITFRPIPSEWTEAWLAMNHFPCEPVITLRTGSKVATAREQKLDLFVDDKMDNFVELNKAGICTFLFDQPYNRRYDVGYKRIKSLNELI